MNSVWPCSSGKERGGSSGRSFAPGRGGFYAGGLVVGARLRRQQQSGALVDNSYTMPEAKLSLFGGYDYPIGKFVIARCVMAGRW